MAYPRFGNLLNICLARFKLSKDDRESENKDIEFGLMYCDSISSSASTTPSPPQSPDLEMGGNEKKSELADLPMGLNQYHLKNIDLIREVKIYHDSLKENKQLNDDVYNECVNLKTIDQIKTLQTLIDLMYHMTGKF